jgi:DNA-binding GntR family transcriptional regulator
MAAPRGEPWKKQPVNDTSTAESLRKQVYQTLRTGLRKGRLGSSRTATERDLAEQLGVSRTPVREALVLLVHDGLIAATRRGFSLPELSRQDILDLFQVRRMLEPAALATTVEHLSAHDLRMLRESLKQQAGADRSGDVESFVAANSRFRSLWLAVVPNPQLRQLMERHDDHAQWLRQVTLHDPKVRKNVIAGLTNILTALEAGKPAAVETAMRAHLEAAEDALTAALAQRPGSSSDRLSQ